MEIPLIIFGAFVLLFAFVILRNKRINGDIDQNGIETDAVVSRVTETVSSDSDGMVSISHTYYVTYRAMNGQTVEAQLGSGKSVDFRIGKRPGTMISRREPRCGSNTCPRKRTTRSA